METLLMTVFFIILTVDIILALIFLKKLDEIIIETIKIKGELALLEIDVNHVKDISSLQHERLLKMFKGGK